MIQILRSCLHTQRNRTLKVNLKFGNTINIVQNPGQYQVHPIEQISAYPVNYCSQNSFVSIFRSISETDLPHIDSLVHHWLIFHNQLKNFVFDIVILKKNSALIKLHHVLDTLNFINNEEVFRSPLSSSFRKNLSFLS